MQIQTLVVIGAGASGLQSARAVLKRGRCQVLILEQGNAVGGVWTKPYLLNVQVPHIFYEFAEFPWPAHLSQDASVHPSSQAVQAYIQAYAEHFGLIQHIRFGCQLLRLQPAPQGGWAVIYLDKASGSFQVVTADYVVMATGMYCVPNVPVYKGMQHFRGLQLHSNDFTDPALLTGKRVVVVGSGRSALDCASMVAASQQAAKVTWLFRQAHWPIPQQIAPGLPMHRFIFSRLPSVLLPPYYTATDSQQGMHKLSMPLKSSVWKWLQSSIVQQFDLKDGLLPALPLQQDLLYYGLNVDAEWSKVVQRGLAGGVKRSKRTISNSDGKVFWQLLKQEGCLSCTSSGSITRDSSRNRAVQCSTGGLSCTSSRCHDRQQQLELNGSRSTWWGKLRGKQQPRPTTSDSSAAACKDSGTLSAVTQNKPVTQDYEAQQLQSSAAHALAKGIAGCASSKTELGVAQARTGGSGVELVCGDIERCGRDFLLLRSGGAVPADVVLYCTGYNKSYDYLDSEPRGRLGLQKDGLPLYRHMLPPLVPGLAFIGCEASSYNTMLTAGLQAEWLAAVLAGQLVLPEVPAMQEDVRRMTAWMRNVFPPHRHRASAVQLYMTSYHAQLLQDMHLQPPHHSWLLQPITAHDYSFAFKLPLGISVQGRPDTPVNNEECEGGMESVAAATEQAQRSQQSFTATQLSSVAGVAVAMTPSALGAGFPLHSQAASSAPGSGTVEVSPVATGQQQQQEPPWQCCGSSRTSLGEHIQPALPEQSVKVAAPMPVAVDAGRSEEQQWTQRAQPRSRSATPVAEMPVQDVEEWRQQLNLQQQDGIPVSSSMNASTQAGPGCTALWSGSNAWFITGSHAVNVAEISAEADQQPTVTSGNGMVAGTEEASYTARMVPTSTFESSSNSIHRSSNSTEGDASAATAAAASGGCRHHKLRALQHHRPLQHQLQQPGAEATSAVADGSSLCGMAPATAQSGIGFLSAPSTPKMMQGMLSSPVDCSSRVSLAAMEASAAEFGPAASSSQLRFGVLKRSSSGGCITGMSAGRRVSNASGSLKRSSSLAAPAAAAAVAGCGGSLVGQQCLHKHRSHSCHSCAAVYQNTTGMTLELTKHTVEQQEDDDWEPVVLPGPSRQVQAVQRWLDSLPSNVIDGNGDDPDFFEHSVHVRQRSNMQSAHSGQRKRAGKEQQQQQRLMRAESASAGKSSAHVSPAPFIPDVLGGCGAAVPSSRQRSRHNSLCMPDSLQEQHPSCVPSSSWEQVEAAVAAWRQQEQDTEQQQLVRPQNSLAKQVLQRTAATAPDSTTFSCPNKLPSKSRAMSLSSDAGLVDELSTAILQHRHLPGRTPVSSPAAALPTAGSIPSMSRTAASAPSPVVTTVSCCNSDPAGPVMVSLSVSPLAAAELEAHIGSPLQRDCGLEGTGNAKCACAAGRGASKSFHVPSEGHDVAPPRLCNGACTSRHESSAVALCNGSVALGRPCRTSNGGNSSAMAGSSNMTTAGPGVEQYVQDSLKSARSSSAALGLWITALGHGSSSSFGRQMSKLCRASSPTAAELVSCYEQEQMAANDMECQRVPADDAAAVGEATPVSELPSSILPLATDTAAVTPQLASSVPASRGLRSLVRHLSLPAGRPPATPSATASVAAGSRRGSLRLGRGARTPSCSSTGGPVSAAPALTSSGTAVDSVSGRGNTPKVEMQPQPAAAVGGQYEFYSLPGQQPHSQLHHSKLEEHPLASLKAMLNQMRDASDAIEQQKQHAVMIANMASKQQAAVAGKGRQLVPAVAAAVSGATDAASAAVGAVRLNRTMSLDSRGCSGVRSSHQLRRQKTAAGTVQHATVPFGCTFENNCSSQQQVLQQLRCACSTAAVSTPAHAGVSANGVPTRPSPSMAAVRKPQQHQCGQGCSNNASVQSPWSAAARAPRLTAELLAIAAAADAGVDEDCYSSKCGSQGRPSADNLRGSAVARTVAATLIPAAVHCTTAAADCGLGTKDAGRKKQDHGGSSRMQSYQAPSGSGPATPHLKGSAGGQGSPFNLRSVQGTISVSSSYGASGWAGSRTQNWLQQEQQQLHTGRAHHSGAIQKTAADIQQQQQQCHAGNAGVAAAPALPAAKQQTAPPTAAMSAANTSRRTGNSSVAGKRRSRSGLVLERLGSKAAALKQLYVLQCNPDAVGELVQSLKAWQASPEAAAAARAAARGSMDA